MASFLTDLVKPYVEKLINGAITESSYICCFTCIAKNFEDEKAKLEVERTTFNQHVDVATRGGEDLQASALFWKKQADELIHEDTKTKKCFFGFCCNCIWQYRRGKELAKKKEQIKRLIETRKELAIGLPAHLPDVERYSSQHYIPFKSRESKCKELLDALNDDNNYIVGLHGMGGTGKTTLAMEVGKKLKQSKQFTQVIDTTVSFSPDIKKIQDDIAGPLGILKFDECNESDRPKKLWSRLTNGEKILLILDDVWGDINFNEIGIPYSDNRKGCSVLVTTRDLSVCNRLGCSSTIQLDLLSEDDAWIMFQRHAGLSDVSTKDLLKKGRKIAIECKRLPIVIAAIASSLKGEQRREKWDVALNALQKHMSIGGVEEDLVDSYKGLEFSYDHLKNKNAKELFLLCSIFQEDEEISIEILTRLGIGAGLFGEGYEKYNNARNLVVAAKDTLLDSCLLLKTNDGDVKMHDLVREVALWIANKDQTQVVNFSNKNQKSLVGRDNNIKYLLFDGNPMDLFSFGFDGSKLMILIFNMGGGCFEDVPVSCFVDIFENIAGLRVLNLRADYQTMPLPQSIRLLMNLRSLIIESAELGDISVLGSLQSLETFDLKICKIDKLPEEIAKLKKLRLLNLDRCDITRNNGIQSGNPFEVIQRCPSLEELYFIDSFNHCCREITLPTQATLERYHLIEGYSVIYDSSLSKCVSLRTDHLSEATFKHVMQTAEHLKLERIEKRWTNIMPEIVPIDQGMNGLIVLHLKHDSQLQCLVDTIHIGSQVPNVFSNLVVLELEEMKSLKELCNGPISSDSLNNLEKLNIMSCGNLRSLFKGNLNLCHLKTLKIEGCYTLVSVFDLSTSQSLLLLESLEISDCEQLDIIFTNERKSDDKIEVDNNKSCNSLFPKLKVVNISNCPQLQFIFPTFSAKDLLLLETINIQICGNLKHIFGQQQDVELASLKKLWLDDLPNFIGIFPESYHSSDSLNSLEELTIEGCWNLRSLFKGNLNLCNLKTVEIRDCGSLVSVFHLSSSGSLPVLEELNIINCKQLENIFTYERRVDEAIEEILVPKLKYVLIDSCDKLTYIFDQQVKLDSLIKLELLDVPNFKDIFPKSDNSISKTETELQLQVEPIKSNIFSCCYRSKTTKVPSQACSISPETSSYCFSIWERAQCLSRLSHIMCNIKVMELAYVSKIKSVFMLSIAPKMSLERLTISYCGELEHIVVDIGDGSGGNELGINVFPKLKVLYVVHCWNLEYIFGHINASDGHDQNNNKVQLHLPALKSLKLVKLQSLISMCPKQYHTTFPALKQLEVGKCSQVDVKSIGDFTFHASVSRYQDSTTIKQFNGNMEHFLALEMLNVYDFNAESILCLNEESEREIHLGLQIICLRELHMMISLFVGPKNTFALKNLKRITIYQCEKLEIVFSTSVLRCLSQLCHLIIQECNELKHIIEDDDIENAMSSKTCCFPVLQTLAVVKCNKLKSVFPISMRKELPELKVMLIRDADELEEIFKSVGDDDQKIEIPKLEAVGFANLPSLCHVQGIQFQEAVKVRLVHNCKKLSLVTSLTSEGIDPLDRIDYDVRREVNDLFENLMDEIEVQVEADHIFTSSQKEMNRTPETTEDEFRENVSNLEVQSVATSPTNSKELISEKSTSQQQHSLGENDTTIKLSQGDDLEDSMSTIPETKNVPPVHLVDLKQKGIQVIFEEGTASTSNANPITSSTHLELASLSSEQLVTYEDKVSSQELLNEQSKSQQHSLEEIDNAVPPSQATEISVEEGTTSTNDKTIASAYSQLEDGDAKKCIPSTKDIDIRDSQETNAMEDINKLIEEDPLLALEKLLTGVQSFSIGSLLQELKTLMDSSSEIDHLVSNQESKLKLISLFHGLNQHQGVLPSDVKEYVVKVQNFFNDNIIKQDTALQVLKKHNQLLDLKTDLMNKFSSAKSTQIHIDSETAAANAKIHELSLQIEDLENQRDGLKLVVNKCDVQKMKLKAECTELAQQSKKFISALASSEVDVREAERARNLAKEGFENLKSSFPTF